MGELLRTQKCSLAWVVVLLLGHAAVAVAGPSHERTAPDAPIESSFGSAEEALVRAQLRFSHGGFATFVGAQGLLVTTRTAIERCLDGRSGDEPLVASAQAEERPCPGLRAALWVRAEDVTEQLQPPEPTPPEPTPGAPTPRPRP